MRDVKLDKESEVPADFSDCSVLDAVLDRRVSVTPMQLLDTAEVSQNGTSATRPITPSSIASITEEPPSPVRAFRPAEVDTAESHSVPIVQILACKDPPAMY